MLVEQVSLMRQRDIGEPLYQAARFRRRLALHPSPRLGGDRSRLFEHCEHVLPTHDLSVVELRAAAVDRLPVEPCAADVEAAKRVRQLTRVAVPLACGGKPQSTIDTERRCAQA